MVTGGADACVTPYVFAGFDACRAMSTRNDSPEKACRPFDRERDGFVMGEGAGLLLFEELEHARRRGAHLYAEVVGFGMTADAYHLTDPDPALADFDLVPLHAREARLDHILSNSFGFGGIDSCIVLSRV